MRQSLQPSRDPAERAAFAAIRVRGHVDVPLVKSGAFDLDLSYDVPTQAAQMAETLARGTPNRRRIVLTMASATVRQVV